ncbi:unnamed protein product [Caenorhabditis nigoni]
MIAEQESGKWAWRPSTQEYPGYSKDHYQYWADRAREKLKPFHCRRHNLPRPFNCYIQLSTMKDGVAKPLQRLAYSRTLYEAVKHFNHILLANRPVINVLECQVYRIPVGFKISANDLTVEQSQIASIATIIEGDVNTLRVFEWDYVEDWWQNRLVKNASELITEDTPLFEKSCLMLRMFVNKIIRIKIIKHLTTEHYCELIENWMSVKRDVGSELWIEFRFESCSGDVLEMIQTRMEVVRRDERCVRLRDENGTLIEVCDKEVVVKHSVFRWAVNVKIIEN